MKITGTFTVTMNPLDFYTQGQDGVTLGRMTLDKDFSGELAAKSKGEMLTARTQIDGSAGYVALEQVSGTLSGKKGSFVLQHFGILNRGKDQLILDVVPDSGTGGLTGLVGQMNIRFENNQHYYDFDYELDQ